MASSLTVAHPGMEEIDLLAHDEARQLSLFLGILLMNRQK